MLPVASGSWRWDAAVEIGKLPDQQAQYALRSADESVRRAYRFKRSKDRQYYCEDEALDAAFDISRVSARKTMKRNIECLILGGLDNAGVSKYTQVHQDAVKAYADIFFDVRPFLALKDDGAAWVAEQLFGGVTFKQVAGDDHLFLFHRHSWIGGHLMFRALTHLGSTAELETQMGDELHRITLGIMRRQAAIIPFLHGFGHEDGLNMLKISLETLGQVAAQQTPAHLKSLETLKQGTQEFLRRIPLSVADPTKRSKVLLADGREPRAADLLKESRNAPVALNV